MAGGARRAGAAAAVAQHHVVARPDLGDTAADPLDHAGTFVPEHDRMALFVPG